MNTLVEKVFGVLLFVGFFVPYTFGTYLSTAKSYEFNNVTTEIAQMIKEEGAYYGETMAEIDKTEIYNTKYNASKASGKSALQSNEDAIKELNRVLKAYEDNSSSAYNYVNSTLTNTSDTLRSLGYSLKIVVNGTEYDANKVSGINIPITTGDTVQLKFKFKQDVGFGWVPEFTKTTNIKIYKR